MRHDMHKVIVERPRLLRASWKNKKTGLRFSVDQSAHVWNEGEDYDSGPRRASSSSYEKPFNENLAPLKRYLHKQVGRPWDKVYSEICRTLDRRSTVGEHVLQHVSDFVMVETFLKDGVVYGRLRSWDTRPVDRLYVHPVTRLLRDGKKKAR